MKKLGKILINSEKVIKNEELVNLKGGWYPGQECPNPNDHEFSCNCVGSIGEWNGCYSDVFEAIADGEQNWCASGTVNCFPAF